MVLIVRRKHCESDMNMGKKRMKNCRPHYTQHKNYYTRRIFCIMFKQKAKIASCLDIDIFLICHYVQSTETNNRKQLISLVCLKDSKSNIFTVLVLLHTCKRYNSSSAFKGIGKPTNVFDFSVYISSTTNFRVVIWRRARVANLSGSGTTDKSLGV